MGIDNAIAIFSGCAVVVVAILRLIPNRNGVKRELCDERHKSIDSAITDIKIDIRKIFEILSEIQIKS